jgi:NAD(P)-dependent dehydrogenase (short-subunit alcohol dehydrogenase family)
MTAETPPPGGVLDGRVVVVTGGNGGIGLAIAEACARAGASVAVWATNPDKNTAALERLVAAGARAVAHRCDVRSEEQVDAALDRTVDELGRVDTLFANAGIKPVTPFLDMGLDEWRRVMAVNLDGAFLTMRAAARHMVARGGGGALVAVSSVSAFDGSPGMEHYAASKAGVLALVRSVAVELARHAVRCNALIPGFVDTEMTADWRQDDRMMDATTRRTPVRRWGEPVEIGPAAVFLADPDYRFHTGTNLVVDGGYSVA